MEPEDDDIQIVGVSGVKRTDVDHDNLMDIGELMLVFHKQRDLIAMLEGVPPEQVVLSGVKIAFTVTLKLDPKSGTGGANISICETYKDEMSMRLLKMSELM